MSEFLFPEQEFEFVDVAVERVKDAWDIHRNLLKNDRPMLLAFSGGKDSVCLYGVCRKASESLGIPFTDMFRMQYNITCVDPPELVRFVRDFPEKVHLHHPKKTMWQLIIEKHLPPLPSSRYCCAELKEVSSIRGGYTLTGVRHAESSRRAKRGAFERRGTSSSQRILLNDNEDRRQTEYCSVKASYICNPIIDWTEDNVWDFIRRENLPYCCLYDEGFSRLGCIGCPMAPRKSRERDFKRWPGYEKAYKRTFKKMLENNMGGGTERLQDFCSLFE